MDEKVINLEKKIELLHGELLLMKKDFPIVKAAVQSKYNYNEHDVLEFTLSRVLKTVEDSNTPTSSVLIGKLNFLMSQHNQNKKNCSCQKCKQRYQKLNF